MQKIKLSAKTVPGLLLPFLLIINLTGGITSCAPGNKAFGPVQCMQITKSNMQQWVRKGWTTPGDADFITKLVFIPVFDDNGKDIKVTVYPVKNIDEIINNGDKELEVDQSCSQNLPPFALGRNYIDFKLLKLTDAYGKFTDFSFIRLTPGIDPSGILNFTVDVIKEDGSGEHSTARAVANPCPPPQYCPKE